MVRKIQLLMGFDEWSTMLSPVHIQIDNAVIRAFSRMQAPTPGTFQLLLHEANEKQTGKQQMEAAASF